MPTLNTCSRCDGFLPAPASACPHCGARHLARQAMRIAVGGAVAVTLMACYGGGPRYDRPPQPAQQLAPQPTQQIATEPTQPAAPEPTQQMACAPADDADGDGVCPPADCNDGDATVHPGASDTPGDGIDQDCDGADASSP